MTDQANFTSTRVAGAMVLDIRGEVDILNAGDLRSAIHEAAASGSGALIVSLENVAYFDSQTLEILVDFSKRLTLNRRRMLLVAPPGTPSLKLLDVSGISAVIPTYADLDAAVRSAGEAGL